MKIIIISPSFYPATYYGGPIYSNYELAKALRINGFDVKIITTNANGKEKLQIKTCVFHNLKGDLPVKYYHSIDSKGTSFSMLFNLWRDIKDANLVHLISIFSPPTPATLIICRILKKPLIIWPHGQLGSWSLNQGNIFKKLWLKVFIQPFINYAYWNVTSVDEERAVHEVFPTAKTFVTPNIIDLSAFTISQGEKKKSFYNRYTATKCENKNIIISIGRLHKVKGFDILIEAISKVLKEIKDKGKSEDIVLLIAGEDFGESKHLENLIDKLGLKERVFLVGMIEGEDKKEFLRNADVFALASHHENFGIVYAEALASGIPVIASRNTPWEDVEKYKCGKWMHNTPEDFANAISEILDSDPVQMGVNGKKFVEENFNWEKIGLAFKNHLEKILTEKK